MVKTLALHDKGSVHSLRHFPSWLMLTMAAGAVNAGGFLACERFVSHVTGSAMQLSLDTGQVLLRDAALLLVAFVGGAMASTLSIERRYLRRKQPRYALPLFGVAAIEILVAVFGRRGAFGDFGGGANNDVATVIFLAALGFAMGMQNAAVATTTGLAVRTTHLTGPATDLGVQMATAFYAHGKTRRDALRIAVLRGGKIVAFILGAFLMVPLAGRVQYLAFLAPAALVIAAAVLSFLPERRGGSLRLSPG